jgi:acyl-CoA reductase-like NAD-dependent aldehyde dehydrogenase
VSSPFSGEAIARAAWGCQNDVEDSIGIASRAMAETALEPFERAEVLERTSDLIGQKHDQYARTLSAEAGKPIKLARLEVDRARSTLAAAARGARQLSGDVVPLSGESTGAGHFGITLRVPVGVVAAITPFNFPLNLVCHKVAPAIAAGCGVVVKPADKTPLSALALADDLYAAGLPGGLLSVVVGDPVESADSFLRAPDVGLLSFTGSSAVGWQLAAKAERTRVKLELGNVSPLIVTRTGDLRQAARETTRSAFGFAGQTCTSTQRVLVDVSRKDEFLEILTEEVDELRVGDPADPDVDVGPLITTNSHTRVLTAIEEAVGSGAEVLRGGSSLGNNIVEPTILVNVASDANIACREVFGPVVSVIDCESTADAIDIVNSTDYGLQSSIFTQDLSEAMQAARELQCGSVIVNDSPSFRSDPMPYGGTKGSGNTKEGPEAAILEMTEERLVVIRQ